MKCRYLAWSHLDCEIFEDANNCWYESKVRCEAMKIRRDLKK